MTRAPWDYLFETFNSHFFPDIFHPTWIAAAVMLIVLAVLYYWQTRALHRHPPYLDMWEWIWWTGLITFSLLLVEALFVFDYLLVLLTQIIGIGTLVWVRFVRFPPILRAYEAKLARERYFTRQRFAEPEATIRRRGGRRQTRRRRR